MIRIDPNVGQILDVFAILLFFVLLVRQTEEFRNKKNFIIVLCSTIMISYIDLKFNFASLILLPLIYFLFFRIKSIGFEKNLEYLVKPLLLSIISTNISGLLLIDFFSRIKRIDTLSSNGFVIGNVFLTIVIILIFKGLLHRVFQYIERYIDSWSRRLVVYAAAIEVSLLVIILTITRLLRTDTRILANTIIFFTVTLLILTVVFAVMVTLRFSKIESENEKKRISETSMYLAELEENYKELQKFKHDYRNLLISVQSLADDGNINKINQLLTEAMHAERKSVSTNKSLQLKNMGDGAVKGLLLNKYFEGSEKNIKLKIEISEKIPDLGNYTMLTCRVLGILLDNSLDAVADTCSKKINIAFVRMRTDVEVIISNVFDNADRLDINRIYDRGYTTKGKNRGLGLSNVREIINSTDNMFISVSVDHNVFTVTITITNVLHD